MCVCVCVCVGAASPLRTSPRRRSAFLEPSSNLPRTFLGTSARRRSAFFEPSSHLPRTFLAPSSDEWEEELGILASDDATQLIGLSSATMDASSRDLMCGLFTGRSDRRTRSTHVCVTAPDELLFIPSTGMRHGGGFWHGTCNLDEWSAGFTFHLPPVRGY